MKNNFLKYLFLVLIFFINIPSISDEVIFETEEINITEGGQITKARNGKVNFIEENFEVNGDTFIYDKKTKKLIVTNAKSVMNNDNLIIEAREITYNRNTLEIVAKNNVKLKDLFNKSTISSEELIYNLKSKKIISNTPSKFEDNYNNSLFTRNFSYDLNNSIAKIDSLKIVDSLKNEYSLKKSYYNTKSKKLVGKDVFVDLGKAASQENKFRIKSLGIEKEEKKTILKKAVFTPCKKTDTCPPWQISAETITHDQEKKTMYYKNAWLEIYDKKVLYFPKFFHPDPTVKRQSGFLIPSFASSKSLGSYLNIPYYKVIAGNKDLTFKPRLYFNNKILAQTEYRQIGKDYSNDLDFGLLSDNGSNRTHFFSKMKKELDLNLFEESDISIDIQQVSNDSYLKSYKPRSPLINNDNILTSTINFSGFNDDLSFNTEFIVYENLSKTNNDRYEHILPSYNLSKGFDNLKNLNGRLEINSSGSIKSYNTNILEKVNINDLVYNSDTKITSSGIENNFNFIIKNVNTESDNSTVYKNNFDSSLDSLFEFNSSYPLIKKNDKFDKLITPKISLRYNPNKTKNKTEDIRQINYDNIFDLNRLSFSDTLEGGESLTFGSKYSLNDKSNNQLFSAQIANVIRIEEDKNIPESSSIGQKNSNIVSTIALNPLDNLNFNYQLSMDQSFDKTEYQLLSADLSINNFVTTFEYLNESSNFANDSYLYNKSSYNFNEKNSLSFKTRENKKEKITEFYNLIYEYKNDCLIAAVEYSKDYYNFQDLKPEEKLFFKLTIVPFGTTSSPSLY